MRCADLAVWKSDCSWMVSWPAPLGASAPSCSSGLLLTTLQDRATAAGMRARMVIESSSAASARFLHSSKH